MKIGTGWLGWAPEAVMDMDMTDIVSAYEGKVEMLKACFGAPEKRKAQPMSSVKQFDAAFG